MAKPKRKQKALAVLNYDLFESLGPSPGGLRAESLYPPAPATIDSRIRDQARRQQEQASQLAPHPDDPLPSISELYRRFDVFNWLYFGGSLPRPKIEYSTRMSSAGSYTPQGRIIKIGRKYHELFPQDIDDTLKHEMIHILHFYHDANFKREARRIGASMKARSHPSLRKPPRYIYQCPGCGRKYPRQRRFRMSSCGYCSAGGRYDERYKLKLVASLASKARRAR